MITRFYFPTSLEDALAVMRHRKRLDCVCATENHTFFAYSDRDIAIRQVSQNAAKFGEEICLVVVEFPTTTLNELFMGDGTHFGPCAQWRSEHVVELEAHAEGVLTQHSRYSLELIPTSSISVRNQHACRD